MINLAIDYLNNPKTCVNKSQESTVFVMKISQTEHEIKTCVIISRKESLVEFLQIFIAEKLWRVSGIDLATFLSKYETRGGRVEGGSLRSIRPLIGSH